MVAQHHVNSLYQLVVNIVYKIVTTVLLKWKTNNNVYVTSIQVIITKMENAKHAKMVIMFQSVDIVVHKHVKRVRILILTIDNVEQVVA